LRKIIRTMNPFVGSKQISNPFIILDNGQNSPSENTPTSVNIQPSTPLSNKGETNQNVTITPPTLHDTNSINTSETSGILKKFNFENIFNVSGYSTEMTIYAIDCCPTRKELESLAVGTKFVPKRSFTSKQLAQEMAFSILKFFENDRAWSYVSNH